MHKKIKYLFIIPAIAAGIVILLWQLPTYFLRDTEPEEIASIHIFNGNSGNEFEVTDTEDIAFITEHIRQSAFKKDRCSLMYSGFLYRMHFVHADGQKIQSFIVNSDDTIRKDPFFYTCDGNMGVVAYLEHLENERFPHEK